MEDSTANVNTIRKQGNRAMGQNSRYIVEAGKASPSGVVMDYCIVLADVTDFACTDTYLKTGSGSYPTSFAAGMELPSGLKDISVTAGQILCIYS